MDTRQLVKQHVLVDMSGLVNHQMFAEEFPDHDVMEIWLVTDVLAYPLLEKGEAVIKIGQAYIWGRTGTGQAKYMDSVFQEISEEHDW
ncbi:MAG: hypothetical protein J7525_19830 [Roseofilum sp. SID3]|uniref:hypothetical protein n=1 Tax=Roseofilum sp. SID3 TaxID=2821499 RepID=UPI001B1F9E0B|nr:hypothetical protein [Roseofilum sp. SID3]MBP0015347.1 hypothetical protein [Roseofilum sp. SID3]